jgi:hypothetical protein
MKSMQIVLAASMLMAAVGCQPDAKTEARLRHVEERQQNLRDDLIALNGITAEVKKILQELQASNAGAQAEARSNVQTALSLVLEMQEDMEAVRATNQVLLGRRLAPVAARPVYAPAQLQTREGVPLVTYNEIAAEATRKWPGNFEMQAYEIKLQTEAYRKLHP